MKQTIALLALAAFVAIVGAERNLVEVPIYKGNEKHEVDFRVFLEGPKGMTINMQDHKFEELKSLAYRFWREATLIYSMDDDISQELADNHMQPSLELADFGMKFHKKAPIKP